MRYRSDLGKSRSTGRITGFAEGSALASAMLEVVDAWPPENSTNPRSGRIEWTVAGLGKNAARGSGPKATTSSR